jgi:hypothetical protein
MAKVSTSCLQLSHLVRENCIVQPRCGRFASMVVSIVVSVVMSMLVSTYLRPTYLRTT